MYLGNTWQKYFKAQEGGMKVVRQCFTLCINVYWLKVDWDKRAHYKVKNQKEVITTKQRKEIRWSYKKKKLSLIQKTAAKEETRNKGYMRQEQDRFKPSISIFTLDVNGVNQSWANLFL